MTWMRNNNVPTRDLLPVSDSRSWNLKTSNEHSMAIRMALILIAGLLGGLLSAAPAMPRSGILDLGYSRYQGISLHNGVDEFLGMRYAKPPLKDLRWRAPEDPEHTGNNTIDATKVCSCRVSR